MIVQIVNTSIVVAMSVVAVGQTIPPPATRVVSYAEDVHSILAQRCYECHSDDEQKGGLRLDSRDALLEGGESGPAVVVGDSANSRLIQLVSGLELDKLMPNEGELLEDDEIALLRAWIDQGLSWDEEPGPRDTWQSPLALQPVKLPGGRGILGSRHPIDRIVGAYFEEHDVGAREVVEDRIFARRVYLDAIGLLPTEAQLESFLDDRRREKRERLIKTLLEDGRSYAEHWMSFWNDALRNDYEGTGYIDGGREQITSWLYEALEANMPYDDFVRALVSGEDGCQGFIEGIVWRGVTAANQQPPLQAARSVSQVFLGVNLKCASCHDSFTNRWKLSDAYGLASAFSEGPLELVRCDTPTGALATPRFLWPELGAVDPTKPMRARRRDVARLTTARENGRFARTIVNRVWARLMGRGLVEPLDNLDARPWSTELHEWLTQDFVEGGYDVRALIARITTSKTYQLPRLGAEEDGKEYVFRGPKLRRIRAEEFLDAFSRVTGVWQNEPKFTPRSAPHSSSEGTVRAWRVPADPLSRALGRPHREQVTTRREEAFTTLQALALTNGEELTAWLRRGSEHLLKEEFQDLVAAIFVRALQREPVPEERVIAEEALAAGNRVEAVEDLLWSILNLPEFQLVQ